MKKTLVVIFAAVVLWGISLSGCVTPPGPHPIQISYLYVEPASVDVLAGYAFTMAVYCDPGTSLKGWEMTVTYDPAILHVEWIKPGNFSQGFGSFFSSQYVIDNKNGTVTKLYEVLIGADPVCNVTADLVRIRFHAVGAGFTSISIRGGRVCNATAYVPSAVLHDAFVTVGPPPTFHGLLDTVQELNP
jgi:hypothetical protein